MEILPFTAKLPSNFGPGSSLKLEVKPTEADAWFSLTLLDGNQILENKYDELKKLGLFQVQLRYDEGIVVLNTVGPGSHGGEEKHHREFDMDKIDIEIRVTNNKYKVYLEDKLVGTFMHRESPQIAKYCNVYGEFEVKKFRYAKKE